ncbi:MAG TPA: hypothetical protein VFE36_10660 [Candidatus Baltobacteraceae bacterium]|jgi:hypothetical protein|nr:hypothetical protein [Candidatus Baltobacteraceae bacterium]
MTQSICAILDERLGKPEKAYSTFTQEYRLHQVGPFGALSEVADGDNVYFATGAGGFLQTKLYGFGGSQITQRGSCS